MDFENHIPSEDLDDWQKLKNEVLEIVRKEEKHLNRFESELQKADVLFSEFPEEKAKIYHLKIESARTDIKKIQNDLKDIRERLANEPQNLTELNSRMNHIGILVGPIIRRGAYLRTRLMRHTPPLQGEPRSPHPQQQHPENDEFESVTVDYLRSSCLFRVKVSDEGDEELRWGQKPLLKDNAEGVTDILFDYKPDTSLAFNSAIGAIKTARSMIEADCMETQRSIALHEKSWLEIKFDIKDSNSGLYHFTETTDGEELMNILIQDDIGGLIIEPVMNHPTMSKMDIDGLLELLTDKSKFDKPKFLLVDSAHVPSYNPFEQVKNDLPSNLCLLNAVSTVKFFQAGWDLTKGGVLTVMVDEVEFDGEPIESLLQTRGNNGTGPSYAEAELMSMETKMSYASRMKRYDRNINLVRNELQNFVDRHDIGEVGFVENAKLLYINLDGELNEKTRDIHKLLLMRANEENIPLMDVSSFGLNTPHIHFVLHPKEGNVLRLSPGSTNRSTVESFISILKSEIENNIRAF